MANFWDRHHDEDRVEFARFLAPLVTASRTKNFTKAEASVYLVTLQDVPRDVLAEGVTRMLLAGVTWMPKPGDIKRACAEVIDERRKIVAASARAIRAKCPECRGTGWADAEGPNAVVLCQCQERAVALMNGVAAPLSLPPSSEPDEAA